MRSSSIGHPRLILVLVVACCLPASSQGFGKSSRTTRLSKRLWKELSDLYSDPPYDNNNNTDPASGITTVVNEIEEEEPRPSRGLFHGLWRRGVKTSAGVRSIGICRMDLLVVRGGSSTNMNHPLCHIDLWARSLALSLAWVVSFQTLGRAMVASWDSLCEVCGFACFCVSGLDLLSISIYCILIDSHLMLSFYDSTSCIVGTTIHEYRKSNGRTHRQGNSYVGP